MVPKSSVIKVNNILIQYFTKLKLMQKIYDEKRNILNRQNQYY